MLMLVSCYMLKASFKSQFFSSTVPSASLFNERMTQNIPKDPILSQHY